MPGQGQPTSVYVHFPWCLKKCPYCDFASAAVRRADVRGVLYADAVISELRSRAPGGSLVSVFFGGGTPSLWSAAELGRTLREIERAFEEHAPDLEVTVECNPTSIDAEKAAALRDVGVNRLSIGVQSLDDPQLRFLGRLHDAEGALRSVRAACGEMPRVSCDLMFGMPGQDPSAFEAEIQAVIGCGVQHVSAYALTIEPATQFGALEKKGKLRLAPEEDFAETFLVARRAFASAGFEHYEVSNYARPGCESRHNLHYWRGGDYLGLGAGAVGAVSGRRYRNDPTPERYLEAPTAAEVFVEHLTAEDRAREALMLGLRTGEGVHLGRVLQATGLDLREGRGAAIRRRVGTGDLVILGERMRVPQGRWLHLDAIVRDLF